MLSRLEKQNMSITYNFQSTHAFVVKVFDLGDKTIGQMTLQESADAHEQWLRDQFGHMAQYYRPHLSLLLSRLDELRAAHAYVLEQLARYDSAAIRETHVGWLREGDNAFIPNPAPCTPSSTWKRLYTRPDRKPSQRTVVQGLLLALQQIKNGCVEDGDDANAMFKLQPSELRRIAETAIAGEFDKL